MADELVAPPSAPVAEASAPAPAPAPEPSPAPAEPRAVESDGPTGEMPTDDRAIPRQDMWKAMLGQAPLAIEASDDPLKPAQEAPAAPRRIAAPAVASGPGVTPTKRWAGRYESPEALETGYSEVEKARDRAETERQRAAEHAERLERLLAASMGRPVDAATAAQVAPRTAGPHPMLKEALTAIQVEAERLALGDPQGDPLRLVRAVALASQLDAESRRVYVDSAHSEVQSRTTAENQIATVQTQFFTEFPDLRGAHPSLLRQIAIEAEDQLRQARPDYGSPAYMRAWFDETAKQARATIRVGDGAAPAPRGGGTARSTTPATARPRSGAPFAETPAPRPQEPALSGQDKHLARVFGRGA